jgi:hypothetical protein
LGQLFSKDDKKPDSHTVDRMVSQYQQQSDPAAMQGLQEQEEWSRKRLWTWEEDRSLLKGYIM